MNDPFAYLIQDESGLFVSANLTLAPRAKAVMGRRTKMEALARRKYGGDWGSYAQLVAVDWPEWRSYVSRLGGSKMSDARLLHIASIAEKRNRKRMWFTGARKDLRCEFRLNKSIPIRCKVAICARSARQAASIGKKVTTKATLSLLWREQGWKKRKPFMDLKDELGVWIEYPKGWKKVLSC